MTETERKALALVNEMEDAWGHARRVVLLDDDGFTTRALCRAIEQHEKFKWEVSYAVLCAMKVVAEMAEYDCEVMVRPILDRFIIAKPDPLVEVLRTEWPITFEDGAEDHAAALRAAIEKRGGKIVWREG